MIVAHWLSSSVLNRVHFSVQNCCFQCERSFFLKNGHGCYIRVHSVCLIFDICILTHLLGICVLCSVPIQLGPPSSTKYIHLYVCLSRASLSKKLFFNNSVQLFSNSLGTANPSLPQNILISQSVFVDIYSPTVLQLLIRLR